MRLQPLTISSMRRTLVVAVVIMAAFAVPGASPAAGQTTATVVSKQAVLRAAPQRAGGVVSVVPVGTTIEVLGQEGDYYRVLLPVDARGVRLAGFLAMADVALVGSPPAAGKQPARPPSAGPARQPSKPGSKTVPAKRSAWSPVTVRLFVDVGYTAFRAKSSFDAIFGTSSAMFPGGGGEVGFGRHLFVRVGGARSRLTGGRAFVFDDEVFPVGIEETLTLTPIDVTAGWALTPSGRMKPYVGGGAGVLKYDERSSGADADENVSRSFTSYHVLGGVEYRLWRQIALAGEFKYSMVPNGLGDGGVSQVFGDTDLGGASVHLKLLVGW